MRKPVKSLGSLAKIKRVKTPITNIKKVLIIYYAGFPEICFTSGKERFTLLVVKNLPAKAGDEGDMGSIPGLGRSPGEGNWQPTPVFLPGESHGERSLAGCSPSGSK